MNLTNGHEFIKKISLAIWFVSYEACNQFITKIYCSESMIDSLDKILSHQNFPPHGIAKKAQNFDAREILTILTAFTKQSRLNP